ncbi:MAG: HipA domain-containing protein, partial [Tannerella sp.]|nr:HipA domain-containing protein [Tannerella sp.]
NHSFIMDRSGQWRLAPAYDLCYSYNPQGRWTNRHQMSINGKQDGFTFEDLETVADRMGIKRGKEIIEKVVDTVSAWDQFAQKAGVKASHAKEIKSNLLLLR